MKKFNFLLCVLMIVFVSSLVFADSSMTSSAESASLGDEGAETSVSSASGDEAASTEAAKEADEETEEKESENETNDGLAQLPNGTAYVGVYSVLNCRDGVWGNIQTTFANNTEVNITGRDGDWYTIDSPREGYVHARYIFAEKDKRYYGDDPTAPGSASSSGGEVVINVSGDSVQGKVISAAQELVNNYSSSGSFPYDPLTENGNLGCAQVVTTALKAAGVINSICLNCSGTISLLEGVGWQSVSVPPYQAGDVVFWETYTSGPSHVGIAMTSGNSVQVMNNSSSARAPRITGVDIAPVVCVYRKV